MKSQKVVLLPPEELFGAIAQTLNEGYDAEFTVIGNSMCPFLCNQRDSVTLRRVGDEPLKKGDIVLLKTENGYLLHRITRLKKGILQTTGDHNCYRDEYASTECVVGRVVRFKRKGKQVLCTNILYRLSNRLWRLTFPLRPILLWLLAHLKRR